LHADDKTPDIVVNIERKANKWGLRINEANFSISLIYNEKSVGEQNASFFDT